MSEAGLVSIVVPGVPVPLWANTRDWFLGLVREFDIIASASAPDTVPHRLVSFVAETRRQFERFSNTDETLDDAIDSGKSVVDVEIGVPAEAAAAAEALWAHIQAAVDYCEEGALLTLTPSDDVLTFCQWYLTEVIEQIGGRQPRRFEEFSGL